MLSVVGSAVSIAKGDCSERVLPPRSDVSSGTPVPDTLPPSGPRMRKWTLPQVCYNTYPFIYVLIEVMFAAQCREMTRNLKVAEVYLLYVPGAEMCYIGSTCQGTSKRLDQHRRDWRKWVARGRVGSVCRSVKLFDTYGPRNVRIDWIEIVSPGNNLEEREAYYIAKYECVNRYINQRKQIEKTTSEVSGPPPIHLRNLETVLPGMRVAGIEDAACARE